MLLDRREFLWGAGLAFGALALPTRRSLGSDYQLPPAARQALGVSPYVYISPLLANGSESTCHGEVWYFVDGGDVVIATGADRWKSRALKRGRDRARIWVGDFGRARSADGPFRQGPSFLARARFDEERATFDRLLESFAVKYADGWDKWDPRFRKGYADGSRVVIRYVPIGQ
jgi:hypothetical protein